MRSFVIAILILATRGRSALHLGEEGFHRCKKKNNEENYHDKALAKPFFHLFSQLEKNNVEQLSWLNFFPPTVSRIEKNPPKIILAKCIFPPVLMS